MSGIEDVNVPGATMPAMARAVDALDVTPHHRRSFAPIHKILRRDTG